MNVLLNYVATQNADKRWVLSSSKLYLLRSRQKQNASSLFAVGDADLGDLA